MGLHSSIHPWRRVRFISISSRARFSLLLLRPFARLVFGLRIRCRGSQPSLASLTMHSQGLEAARSTESKGALGCSTVSMMFTHPLTDTRIERPSCWLHCFFCILACHGLSRCPDSARPSEGVREGAGRACVPKCLIRTSKSSPFFPGPPPRRHTAAAVPAMATVDLPPDDDIA